MIPVSSIGSSQEESTLMTEDSSEPVPPLASPGPSGSGQGEYSTLIRDSQFQEAISDAAIH